MLATLSMTSGRNVFAATNEELDKDVIRSLFLVVVISLFAIEIENLAVDSVLGLLVLFLR